jgi:hypothetical protein
MPDWLPTILAVTVIVISALAALCWHGLMLASMPNGSPQVLRQIKGLMLVVAIAEAASLAFAIVLFAQGEHYWSAGIAGAPVLLIIFPFSRLLVRG